MKGVIYLGVVLICLGVKPAKPDFQRASQKYSAQRQGKCGKHCQIYLCEEHVFNKHSNFMEI